ncbi:MAG: sulfite exporter TauE/SafE family protein, partial [Desulfobacterales bacterium]|nr:sulfite exporter TauE/SafE family protein [Desulfobacterales bacterium]
MYFEVSGVTVSPIIPFLVAFFVSLLVSSAGVSGAFLLLPFQVSVLGFTSPAVSPTNLFYNIVAIPGGVYRFIREKRMAWPLAWVIIIGTLPGIFIGAVLRILYLPDPKNFKFFAGCVLLYIGLRLLHSMIKKNNLTIEKAKAVEERFYTGKNKKGIVSASGATPMPAVKTVEFSLKRYSYSFYGEIFAFNTIGLLGLSFLVGIVGGTYGIGGGAIIAPFLVAFFGLPVYTIAGATLMATFVTSIAGVAFYASIAPFFAHTGLVIAPDWTLGALFGAGGFLGIYCGARLQKYLPAKIIKIILILTMTFIAIRYISAI